MRTYLPLFATLLASWTFAAPALAEGPADPLADYIAQPDDSYGWTLRQRGTALGATYVELTLTSQTWQQVAWRHQLFIFFPAKMEAAGNGLLLIGGGSWRAEHAQAPDEGRDGLPREAQLLALVANQLRAPVAIVLQVPHQPIFNNLREDAAISYTFDQFMRTGDPQWPLLLPMVKSTVRAMDAVQEFARDEFQVEVERFTVTGASKRGWTTWLTAAVDPRVQALAPMVIDMLNMNSHLDHQLATWGTFSEQISDYTERGLQHTLKTEPGQRLVEIVDPYAYRRRLQQPKLILLGTNDRYWPLDSLNLYWNDLPGQKYILYVPNNPHGLSDYQRVAGSVVALHRHATGEAPLPKLDWNFANGAGELVLNLSSDQPPQQVRAWTAQSATRDFRNARWSSNPAEADADCWRCRLQLPEDGFAAVFAEAVFGGTGLPYYLSTNIRIVGGSAADE